MGVLRAFEMWSSDALKCPALSPFLELSSSICCRK
jgi:hypothetical protein